MEQTKDKVEVRVGQVWEEVDCDDPTQFTVKSTGKMTTLEGPKRGPDTMVCICDTEMLLDPYEWKLIKDI